ncbi:MAG: hypothetical protein ABJG68_15195 [Crocinitomicaceae bacterium]
MKKAVLLFTLMIGFSLGTLAQSGIKKVVAQYQGYDDTYYGFLDENEDFIEFAECDKAVLSKYDLKTEQYVNEYFVITYTERENEDGDIIWVIKTAELEEVQDEIEY